MSHDGWIYCLCLCPLIVFACDDVWLVRRPCNPTVAKCQTKAVEQINKLNERLLRAIRRSLWIRVLGYTRRVSASSYNSIAFIIISQLHAALFFHVRIICHLSLNNTNKLPSSSPNVFVCELTTLRDRRCLEEREFLIFNLIMYSSLNFFNFDVVTIWD